MPHKKPVAVEENEVVVEEQVSHSQPTTSKRKMGKVYSVIAVIALVIGILIAMPKSATPPAVSSGPPPPTSEEAASTMVVKFANELVKSTDPEATCATYVLPTSSATVCDKFKNLTQANLEIFKPIATWAATTASTFEPSTKDASIYKLTYEVKVGNNDAATGLNFYTQKSGGQWYLVDKSQF